VGHSLKGFLHRALIGSPQDDLQYRTANVTLSTIHGVKGLEFACVFIAGCEEGLIPYTLFDGLKTDTGQRTNIEEERRLFYVGMTRAKRSLYLTRAKRRFLFGREYSLEASSFLRTIEEELVARIDSQALKKMRDPQLFLF
jgi:superfamily I DNA/RNA helicase